MGQARKAVWLLPIILLSYFIVGFPDGAFTVSWLGIGEDMPGMTTAHTGWILVGYSAAYTLSGIILSRLNRFMKLQTIYFWGLAVMGLGFIALALSPNFAVVLASITVYGLGTGAMASSMNSYMAKHFTAKHNNWMHFFWGGGAAISPIIMGHMMNVHSWRAGYFVITGILGIVAVMLLISMAKNIWPGDEESAEIKIKSSKENKKYLTKKWHEYVQVATFFFLGGTDYTLVFFTGAALIARGHEPEGVAVFSAVYYAFMTAARMVTGSIAKWLKEPSIIRLSVLISAIGVGILFFTGSVIGMAVVGFGLGPLLPTLVSDTSNAFIPKILPRIVGYELAAFGAGIAALFFLTSQILHFVSYEALFPLALVFIVLVFVCNEVLENAHRKVL